MDLRQGRPRRASLASTPIVKLSPAAQRPASQGGRPTPAIQDVGYIVRYPLAGVAAVHAGYADRLNGPRRISDMRDMPVRERLAEIWRTRRKRATVKRR